MKILLIGDSILDNDVYVGKDYSVSNVLKKMVKKISPEAQVINNAVDGFTTIDVINQVENSSLNDADITILSIGGNDFLQAAELLLNFEGLAVTDLIFMHIIQNHLKISSSLKEMSKNLIVLDLYYPVFEGYEEGFETKAYRWIEKFNSSIRNIYDPKEIVQISKVFTDKEDFTNFIEPSKIGTRKLVKAIISKMRSHRFLLNPEDVSGGANA